MYKKSVFIFRRSFRLDDNTGLLHALKQSKKVIPIFIFTPEQVIKNSYKSNTCVQFMVQSLQDLDQQLRKKGSRLFYFFGKPDEVVQKLIKKHDIDAVCVNMDYTPYARKRDKKIAAVCKKHKIDFVTSEDILLNPVGSIQTGGDSPYLKYTPFFRKARRVKIKMSVKNNHKNYISRSIKLTYEFRGKLEKFYKPNEQAAVNGGRKEALKIIKRLKYFKDYDKKRNLLTYQTTMLSAYIKFGCVSIREVYHAIKKATNVKDLIKQLYWRDFYYNIAYFFPYVFGAAMKKKYNKIKWPDKKTWFEKWKKGKTGFPVVDACMRELNTTGFMHNRGRLIVSSFLIKILFVDWRKGEKYFAKKLIDYDPSVNNGNWQWSASTGADSQPFFRVFNPWLQSKKFGPTGEYIKKWVPELQDVPTTDIHRWDTKYKDYKKIKYPTPIVDYKKNRKKILSLYKKYIQ